MSVPSPSRPIPLGIKVIFGPPMLGFGLAGLAVAFGWIELGPSRTHTPLWIPGAIGLGFLSMGLVLVLDGIEVLKTLRGWMALTFLLSFASVFNWVAFGPGERLFTSRSGIGSGSAHMAHSAPADELTGRIMFGIFAVLLDLLILSPLLLKLFRRKAAGKDGR